MPIIKVYERELGIKLPCDIAVVEESQRDQNFEKTAEEKIISGLKELKGEDIITQMGQIVLFVKSLEMIDCKLYKKDFHNSDQIPL